MMLRAAIRSRPITSILRRFATESEVPEDNEIGYGALAFTKDTMKNYLDRKSFTEISDILDNRKQFTKDTLDKYVDAVALWSTENGFYFTSKF